MIYRRHYIMTFLIAFFCMSCSNDDFMNEEEKEKIIIEGWIKSEDFPVVMVTTSLKVSMESQPTENLSDHVLNWARVSVSDGEKEVVLTGFHDENYFPPYIFTTTEMIGEAGKTYTLDVAYKDYHATASTTIPEKVELLNISQQKVEDSDTLYNLTAEFVDPPGTNYYCLFEKKGFNAQQYIKCDVGVFKDEIFNGRTSKVCHPVYQTRVITESEEHTEFFTKDQMVCVELCTLDEQSYNIWSDYQNTASLSGNFFTPFTHNLRSNIKGGLGYWCGYGASNKWVKVGEIR